MKGLTVKRLTPEQIVAAYKAKNLKPVFFSLMGNYGKKACACAIGAYFCTLEEVHARRADADMVIDRAIDDGYDRDYILGVMSGFDMGNVTVDDDIMAQPGFMDGWNAYQAVKAAGL